MEYRVKEIREEKGMTQEALSVKSGVSRATISGLESGRVTVVTTRTLFEIASALEVEVGELFFCPESLIG